MLGEEWQNLRYIYLRNATCEAVPRCDIAGEQDDLLTFKVSVTQK